MFDFDAFADLTGSFNDAIHAGASLVATGAAVSAVFGLADGQRRPNEDPDLKAPRAVARLALLGTLF